MQLEELYRKYIGEAPLSVSPLTPAGSNRRYYRLSGAKTVIGVSGVNIDENEAFIYLTRHFYNAGLNVPEVLAVSDDRMSYLVADLGDISLFSLREDRLLLGKAIRMLAKFHYVGSKGLDYSRCFPVKAFDSRAVMWDLNYFKYTFLNAIGVSYSEPRLEDEFVKLARRVDILTESVGVFMLRDFQSRNVMVKYGEVYFIDYQGGRKGPGAYDIASFLWQAKANFDDDLRDKLIDTYIEEAGRYVDIDGVQLRMQVRNMALVRTLQVLGAYGLRGLVERKSHFLESIPFAIRNLKNLIRDGLEEYPYLSEVLGRLVNSYEESSTTEMDYDGLTVRVGSFSYKKGIPSDPSGNGGGFVFDCRAMDNPGRYDEYKKLTGLDQPVIDFLESKGEITRFLDSCYALVDMSIDNYLSRRFSSLTVNYGCTGGQHRSVYSARHTAMHIKEKYPHVRVILSHRERNIREVL